jgi:hypothetical protein
MPFNTEYDVNQQMRAYTSRFEAIVDAYTERALDPEVIDETGARDAVVTAAVAVDKLLKMNGIPPYLISMMPDVLGAIQALGMEPEAFFTQLVSRAEETAGYRRKQRG